MRFALHPAVCGGDPDLLADYCRHLGIEDLFYHIDDVEGYRDGLLANADALVGLQQRFEGEGLKVSALNDFLPNDVESLVRRCDGLPATLEQMARARIETLILLVLQEESDELWAPLERLYRAIVPRAEALGLKIASHGHWCEGHLAYNRRTIQRIIDFAPAPSNGICLCTGCYHQAGDDVPAIIREIPNRIHCVHMRDTSLRGGSDFEDLFLGAGSVPIREIVAALTEIGYAGLVIPEHLPRLKAERNMEAAHAHAIGYLQGIMTALRR